MTGLVLADVEVAGRRCDVTVRDGAVHAITEAGAAPRGGAVLEGRGGALVPGLHDHHLHLLSLAAARTSVAAGPPRVRDRSGLARALAAADVRLPPGTWLRAVGYHESVAGELDRQALDALVPGRPVRVQHRGGALWMVNSEGLRALGLAASDGRLLGADDLLRRRTGDGPPDLAPVGDLLARYGVTGVTDATPYATTDELGALATATAAIPQAVTAMGGPALTAAPFPAGLRRGPVKLVAADHALPALDDLAGWIARAHEHGRPAAVHAVTRVAVVLALAAWELAGAHPGDRLEHGAVIPGELTATLARRGLTVVTQPHFVVERAEAYRTDVDPEDRPLLYRCATLLAGGVAVAAGTDAPFGDADPWRAIAAAARRDLGPRERVPPARALALFLGAAGAPGGPARTVHAGAPADLCLLDGPLDAVLAEPAAERVVATVRAGEVIWSR